MNLNDKIGHVGYALFAIGNFLIAEQMASGYFAICTAACIWIYLGFKLKMTSIWMWEILCVLTSVYGYWNWTYNS